MSIVYKDQASSNSSVAMFGDSFGTLSISDDESITSNVSEETSANMELLEEFLKTNIATKSYSRTNGGRFEFEYEGLKIRISLRNNDRTIDISSTVHAVDQSSKSKRSSYPLMTKMMKYKAIFNRSNKQQQVGIWDGKVLYIRNLPVSLLKKEYFLELSRKLEVFSTTAVQMRTDFCEEKKVKQVEAKPVERRRKPVHRCSSC
mmetsp:Transcript_26419/g.39053  ORF Transcript_26419/g.39053 Transcript_26419/m.39053 type:complete len:203 (-) Transcript_26419:98-706(-)|eukprot:CAMPEP_0194211682 /NCGR_PEP_ID=MMETSP0156-20130528/10887_1 /TAXON_ID=33649 /ORGANISM="Thalassionema nitzschioides, Strain L26-B" /LENGTH=202 /DNA_ID=CAMNT_0038939309 /DNA_START=82 /DNA_END=690 /DNA_ORIENTATION=-